MNQQNNVYYENHNFLIKMLTSETTLQHDSDDHAYDLPVSNPSSQILPDS